MSHVQQHSLSELTRIEVPGTTIYLVDRWYLSGQGLIGVPQEKMKDAIMMFLRVYESPPFDMHLVGYPVDIAYLSNKYEVLKIDTNVNGKSEPAKQSYRAVEAKAGYFREHNIKVGSVFPYRVFLRNEEERYNQNKND